MPKEVPRPPPHAILFPPISDCWMFAFILTHFSTAWQGKKGWGPGGHPSNFYSGPALLNFSFTRDLLHFPLHRTLHVTHIYVFSAQVSACDSHLLVSVAQGSACDSHLEFLSHRTLPVTHIFAQGGTPPPTPRHPFPAQLPNGKSCRHLSQDTMGLCLTKAWGGGLMMLKEVPRPPPHAFLFPPISDCWMFAFILTHFSTA